MPFGGGVHQNVDLAQLADGFPDPFPAECFVAHVAID